MEALAEESSLSFYERLPALPRFRDVVDGGQHADVPDDWYVVVTDVVSSTAAVAEGRYREVNVLGAAGIACTINACRGARPPYVFGGDGAILLVPAALLERVAGALSRLVWMAREQMGLELRAGAVPVAELRARGLAVRVAKYALSPELPLAMLAGDGLEEATRLVKDAERGAAYSLVAEQRPAIGKLLVRGLNCRWQPIPSRHGEIVALIVKALPASAAAQAAVYGEVLARLDALAGEAERHPVSVATARLADSAELLDAEATLKSGRRHGLMHDLARLRIGAITRIGAALMRSGRKLGDFDGASYPEVVVQHSDTRKFDGVLRMVVDVSAAQRAALEGFLEERWQAGQLVFGTAVSQHALMTCLVYDHVKDHVHFVDGDGGGYTLAAARLAGRLRGVAGGG